MLQPKQGPFRLAKKEGTIQFGYRKCLTYARVFSQTLAYGNSKNDLRKEEKKRGVSMKISEEGPRKVQTAYRYLIKMK